MTDGFIYLCRKREFERFDEDIYKSGRTKNELLENGDVGRMSTYEKGVKQYAAFLVSDQVKAEKMVLKALNERFIQRSDYGTEYFEGNREDMILAIHETLKEHDMLLEPTCEEEKVQRTALFAKEHIRVVESKRLKLTDLYSRYNSWHRQRYNSQGMLRKELKRFMDEEYEIDTPDGWKGIQLIANVRNEERTEEKLEKNQCEYCLHKSNSRPNHTAHLKRCKLKDCEIRKLEMSTKTEFVPPPPNTCRFCKCTFSRTQHLSRHLNTCKEKEEYKKQLDIRYQQITNKTPSIL